MKIDIGIPTFRRQAGLRKAIESAQRERAGRENVRIYVVNNDPEDTLEPIARDYGIEVVTNPVNLGPTGNWNKVIELARAPYLVILHDDDLLLPGRLERGFEALERRPAATMSFCAVEIGDNEGNVTRRYQPYQSPRDFFGGPGAVALLGDAMPVRAPGVMFRLEPLRAVGGYNPAAAELGDIQLYLELVLRGGALYDSHVGAHYRFDTGNLTHGIMFKPRDQELYGIVRAAVARACVTAGLPRSYLDTAVDRMAARHAVISALYRLKVSDVVTARACLDPIVQGRLAGAGPFRPVAHVLRAASHLPLSTRLYDTLRALQRAKHRLEGRA